MSLGRRRFIPKQTLTPLTHTYQLIYTPPRRAPQGHPKRRRLNITRSCLCTTQSRRRSIAGGREDEKVTLLGHWGSAYVTRVRLALHLKGVRYEYVEEDLRNKSDLLLRCNPVHRAVPVLIHNGRPVCESRVILQYIDEAFGPPVLLPADPHERAVARFWAAYADDVLGAPWEKSYRAGTEEERAGWMSQVVAATDALERGLSECTDGGSKGCFFGGERVGFVDVVLGGVVPLVHATVEISGDVLFSDAGRTPLLAAWLQRFGELEAAKALLPEVDRVVDYVRMIHAKNAAVKAPAN